MRTSHNTFNVWYTHLPNVKCATLRSCMIHANICGLYVIMLKNTEAHYDIHAPQHTMYILKCNQRCICKQFSKILCASYITYTSLVCHWYCIGVGLVNTFANTSLKLCVLFTLHTAHCSHLFSKTLFALQTADTSLMQRCLSQYWLKFFQSAGQGCDCWPTRKICGKRFNRAGNFPRGGWVPPFAVHTFQKQNSSSPPPLKPSCFLQQPPATSQAPSQMPWGGKPFPERYYFHKKMFCSQVCLGLGGWSLWHWKYDQRRFWKERICKKRDFGRSSEILHFLHHPLTCESIL